MVRNQRFSAEDMIRSAGVRVTQPRVCVLAALLDASRALTHREVEQRVRRSRQVDRVTVYRVLEWLVANQLAHRVAGHNRVWRFSAVAGMHAEKHAHFECNDCGSVICLDEIAALRRIALPDGFRSQQVEVTVKGSCAGCAPALRSTHRTLRRH